MWDLKTLAFFFPSFAIKKEPNNALSVDIDIFFSSNSCVCGLAAIFFCSGGYVLHLNGAS